MQAEAQEWPLYSDSAVGEVARLTRRGDVFDYAGSGAVTELEDAFSRHCEGRSALTFNSGSSALFAAYSALGLRPDDEVLVPDFTFLATVSPLLWLGARPVLCDSGKSDPSVDVGRVRDALGPRTRAVVVTHVFGEPVDVEAIARFAEDEGLAFVEDCSHAHASTVNGRPVGVFGDAAVFSLGARKMVSGGHGGVLVTSRDDVREAGLLLGHFKPRARNELSSGELRAQAEFGLGGNLRMSPLAAVLALDHITRLPALSRARRANVALLDEALAGRLTPVRAAGSRINGTFFDVVYRIPDALPTEVRDELLIALQGIGIPVRAPATRPLHRTLAAIRRAPAQRAGPLWERLADLAARSGDDHTFPRSSALHDRMVSFPATHLHAPDLTVARRMAASLDMFEWRRLGWPR